MRAAEGINPRNKTWEVLGAAAPPSLMPTLCLALGWAST